MITLDTLLKDIPRIQAKYEPKLAKLKLDTVEDLLRHFPARYDDLSQMTDIANLVPGQAATVIATVEKTTDKVIPGKKLQITESVFSDATGTIRATWFNQRWIADSLTVGKEVRLSGKIARDKRGLCLASPDVERVERVPTSTGRIVPTYPETAGITSKWIRWQIQMLLEKLSDVDDPIPENIRTEEDFPDLISAFRTIHFPESVEEKDRAEKRFAFEDLFILQFIVLRSRARYAGGSAYAVAFDEALIKDFVSDLPFPLTNAQRKCTFQILKDIEKEVPMNRLLNGDVGAGKTLVALIAAYQVVKTGKQVAFLAPTEVLARQHFMSAISFLEKYDVSIALLTGAYKMHGTCDALIASTTRDKLLTSIRKGEHSIIIGTHALIQDDVHFSELALVIVDEQQRFGVAQRSALIDQTQKTFSGDAQHKNRAPHFLTMTATPIPRTYALALFGDLSVSVLDEKPANRKPIKTAVVPPRDQKKIYAFIHDELVAGRQAYVILPLVEESKILAGVKAATEECARLEKEVFPDHALALLHGKMKSKEKDQIMADFKAGHTHILVATSVVEVGVDVPNATVMIIENAERFGLSQLHQFRGRVGRNDMQSYCFLFSESKSNERLKALAKHNDGFKLAEIDLGIRGPGEFIGRRQSGLPDGAMKNIANVKLVEKTRAHARDVIIDNPKLSNHPALVHALRRFDRRIHME